MRLPGGFTHFTIDKKHFCPGLSIKKGRHSRGTGTNIYCSLAFQHSGSILDDIDDAATNFHWDLNQVLTTYIIRCFTLICSTSDWEESVCMCLCVHLGADVGVCTCVHDITLKYCMGACLLWIQCQKNTPNYFGSVGDNFQHFSYGSCCGYLLELPLCVYNTVKFLK